MPILVHMKVTGTRSAQEGLTKKPRHMQAPINKMLTHGLGTERSEQERLTQQLTLQAFFAIPRNPWRHATAENTMSCCASTCPRGRICWATNSVR